MAGRDDNDDEDATVGTLLVALAVVEALGGREDHRQRDEVWAEVHSAVDRWGVERMTDAFGALMVIAMGACGDDEDEEATRDLLRVVVPAVVGAFRASEHLRELDRWLPTVAGALTAAALGRDPYEWRRKLGPLQHGEPVAWCYAVWLLMDLIDFSTNPSGGFADLVSAVILRQARLS